MDETRGKVKLTADQIQKIIINHEYNANGRRADDWYEVFLIPYEGKSMRYPFGNKQAVVDFVGEVLE